MKRFWKYGNKFRNIIIPLNCTNIYNELSTISFHRYDNNTSMLMLTSMLIL